jgi:hypothetical protein
MSPAGLRPKNDCTGEVQQQLKMTDPSSPQRGCYIRTMTTRVQPGATGFLKHYLFIRFSLNHLKYTVYFTNIFRNYFNLWPFFYVANIDGDKV